MFSCTLVLDTASRLNLSVNPTQSDTSFLRVAITDVLIIYRVMWFSLIIIFNAREFSEAFYGATYPVSRKSQVQIVWQLTGGHTARYHERVLLLLTSAEEIKQPHLVRHVQLWRKFKHSGRCTLWTPVYTKTHTCTWSFNSLTSLSLNTHRGFKICSLKISPVATIKCHTMSCRVTSHYVFFHILRWNGWWWSYRWEHCYDSDHGERRSFNKFGTTGCFIRSVETIPGRVCGDKNWHFRTKHYLFLILTKWLLWLNLPRGLIYKLKIQFW